MDASISTDILIGIAAVVIGVTAIYLFMRASGGEKKKLEATKPPEEKIDIVKTDIVQEVVKSDEKMDSESTQTVSSERHLSQIDVERAKSNLRTLTLKRELLGTVLKRLFEAEDSGEITREERTRLSKDYENEIKAISDDLKKSELIVTLNELETLREEIVKRFETALNNTQSRIDSILKELKIEVQKPEAEAQPRRKRAERKEALGEEKAEEEEVSEEEPTEPKKAKSEVEERLEQLRKDVLKELEELDKLEIES